jgi:tRNA threonylcarbamoyladenosine biosynthesis protein TsaB
MSLILSIETSTTAGSVALHKDGKLLASYELHVDKSHSGALTPMLEQLFAYTGFALHEIDAVAIAGGPGSYTGLRIGSATAKGLCFSLDKPLIAINTLQVMAGQVNKFNYGQALLCPMLDARRMEVYAAVMSATGEELMPTQPVIIDESSFADYLQSNKVLFFGTGADKCRPVLAASANAVFIDGVFPSAAGVGELAQLAFEKQQFEDVAYYEPFYLKEFQGPKLKSSK